MKKEIAYCNACGDGYYPTSEDTSGYCQESCVRQAERLRLKRLIHRQAIETLLEKHRLTNTYSPYIFYTNGRN